ncbi:hypothetical protein [Mycolicibacterium gadium]|nr:hypothetical protein [Mycolicibacterium gadium]
MNTHNAIHTVARATPRGAHAAGLYALKPGFTGRLTRAEAA